MMNPSYVRLVVLLATVVLLVMRVSLKLRAKQVPVVKSRIGPFEIIALGFGYLWQVLPLLWLATSVLAFADYSTHPIALTAGSLFYAWGLWLLHLTNRDLGTHWSMTLQLKRDHQLVTEGIYRRIRHPMYLSLLIFSVGQALALPNYVAGAGSLIAAVLCVAFRLGPEERMLLEEFGEEYEEYRKRSSRLIPGLC